MSGGFLPTPYDSVAPSSSGTLAESKKRIELVRIENALRKNGSTAWPAALELGISRVTLYKKLHEHGFMETYARNATPSRPLTPQQARGLIDRRGSPPSSSDDPSDAPGLTPGAFAFSTRSPNCGRPPIRA